MAKPPVHYTDFVNPRELVQIGSFSALENLVISDDATVRGYVYFERLDPINGNLNTNRLGNCQYNILQKASIYDIAQRSVCFSVGTDPSADFIPCNGLKNMIDQSVSGEQGVVIVAMINNATQVWFRDFNNGSNAFGVNKKTLAMKNVNGRLTRWDNSRGYIAFGIPPEANAETEFKSVPRYRINYYLFGEM